MTQPLTMTVARGRRYRLADGREATVDALSTTADKRGSTTTTARFTAAGERGEMRLDRFLALVAEDLGPELAAEAGA